MGVKGPASSLILSFTLSLTGCGGVNPQCVADQEHCEARCQRLKDPKPCEVACDEAASSCAARAARGAGRPVASAKRWAQKVALVDFSGQPIHSAQVSLELGGGAQAQPLWLALPPGGTIAATFQIPDEIKAATLQLTHAPMDDKPIFLTLTVNDIGLASRYTPPRREDGQLKIEQWPLAEALSKRTPGQPIKIFIFNNKMVQSIGTHRIKEIQIIYDQLELPNESDENE